VGGGLDHAARRAGGTDVAILAREGNQEVVTAACAVCAGEAVGQDAALQVLVKGGLDVKGDVGGEIIVLPCAGQIGLQMLADDLV